MNSKKFRNLLKVSILVCIGWVGLLNGLTASAGWIYFKTRSDGVVCSCDEDSLERHMDQEDGKLAAKCKLLKCPDEDGSEAHPFVIDVNGRLFREYVLDLIRDEEVSFPTDPADAKNTLRMCEKLGLPLAEDYICKNVLKIKSRKERVQLQESQGASSSVGSGLARRDEMEEALGHFVAIPGGTFQMGSPQNEANRYPNEAQHSVTLRDFEIGEAAITQEVYAKEMGTNPSHFKEQRYCPESFKQVLVRGQNVPVCADHPVENVSWNDAIQFIGIVNQKFANSDYQVSLPSEAQLEFVFRGGTSTAYVSGDAEAGLGEYVWYSANSNQQTHSVKSKRPNAYGIYRSSVYEWGSDWYAEAYPAGAVVDPPGPLAGSDRVLRGGSWNSNAQFCRSAFRDFGDPGGRSGLVGFRLSRTLRHP